MFIEVCVCAFLSAGSCYRLHAASCVLKQVKSHMWESFRLHREPTYVFNNASHIQVCDKPACNRTFLGNNTPCKNVYENTWVASGESASAMCRLPEPQGQITLPGSTAVYITICLFAAGALACTRTSKIKGSNLVASSRYN